MKKFLLFAVIVVAAISVFASGSSEKTKKPRSAAATGSCVQSGSVVTCEHHTWNCTSAVNLTEVDVHIYPGDSKDGAGLKSGCTGFIGKLNIIADSADGLKVNAASDLTIGSGQISCNNRDGTTHQDGIQVMGGNNIALNNLTVSCNTANDAQYYINSGAQNNNTPTDVVCDGCTFQWQGRGAYGVRVNDSVRSGLRNSFVACDEAHPSRTLLFDDAAVDPIGDAPEDNVTVGSC